MHSLREYAYNLRMRKPSPAKQLVELRTGRPLEELLRDLYVERGFTFTAIAKAIGGNRESVRQWIDEYGLREERPSAEEVVA